MRDAQSPCLRRKVDTLAARNRHDSSTVRSAFQTMELHTWSALLANVKVPPLISRPAARENAAAVLSDTTREAGRSPIVTEFYEDPDEVNEENAIAPKICFDESWKL